jgi:aminoglycoside phosphotransferase (APT) family kinase protein
VVYEKLPGQPLRDCFSALSLVRRRALAEALVAELALLRTVVFAGYGDLLNGTTARWATWQEFVELTVQEGVQAVQSFNLLPPHMKAALLRLSEKIHELTVPACPELNWGDVNMENILVDEAGRLTGLVDFEGALSGDALLTLGYALAFYGWSCFVEALTLAWPEPLKASARRRVEFYAVFRALRSAPYYAHPLLPNGARRMPLAEIYPGLEGALESLAKA